MYTLVIANKNYSSWSLRPWLLMRALHIPFDEVLLPFGDASAWAALRARSGAGKVPCLVDGDLVVWDSLAIVEYLAERHPGVWPEDPRARAWARSAAAEMHSGFFALRNECSMSCGQRVVLRARSKALENDLNRIGVLWQDGLSRFGGPFLAGQKFTAVDAFFAPVAYRFQTYGIELGTVCDDYAARLRALPAMQEWYEAALIEPWREAAHEQEVAAGAASITDLRRA